MRNFASIWLLLLILTALDAVAQSTAPAQPPNIVLIMADDLGYGDLGSYGAEHIDTPNIDRLAQEGVRFTSYYAAAPVCTPTRAALLTGRYPQRPGGLENAIGLGNVGRYPDAVRLAEQHELGLPVEYNVLPSRLEAVGYRSAVVGKWHLGYETKFQPVAHGWDYSIGPLGGGVDYFHHTEPVGEFLGYELKGDHYFLRNGVEHSREGYYLTYLIADESVAWINQQRDGRPFLLYVPFTAPHDPHQGPDDYRPEKIKIGEANDGTPETYAEMIEAMDRSIGEILDKLDEMGIADNTIVIFTSDNGPTRTGSAGPYRGGKGTVFEGGIRVPCIIRWPGHIPPGTVSDQVAITMDLTTSILRIAGAEAPKERPLDGIDIVAHVEQGRADYARTLYWRTRRLGMDRKAVREGDLKYIYDQPQEGPLTEYLFDLSQDMEEQHNLAAERPAEFERLKAMVEYWIEEEVEVER